MAIKVRLMRMPIAPSLRAARTAHISTCRAGIARKRRLLGDLLNAPLG